MLTSLILASACSLGSHPVPQPSPGWQDDTSQGEASKGGGRWGVSAGTGTLPDSGARVSNPSSAPTRPVGSPAGSSRRSSKRSSARGPLSYSYLQVDMLSADYSPSEIEADGFGFLGSFELGDNLFVFAGLSRAEADVLYFDGFFWPGTLQQDTQTVGVGAHFPISGVADVFGIARFSHIETTLDVPVLGIAESGLDDVMSYGIGGRFLVTDALELSLQWEQNNVNRENADTRQMSLGARYHLNDQLAFQVLFGSLEPTEGIGDADILNFGLSFFF